ncbi:unnamed protein product [Sympodiomycopsis kandeliae]
MLVLSSFVTFLTLLPAVLSAPARQSAYSGPSQSKAAQAFYVDGAHIPGISNQTGDLGPSYAGLLPISQKKNDNQKLFFWWWPNSGDVGKDDLVIWLNGGPGCSSLEGLMEENGPFTLTSPSKGVNKAVKNPYSWHKLSNILWVEQPVGVGLGSGNPSVVDEHGVASQFYGFLQNFYNSFPELKSKKLWITGESYAGMYVPYIADYIYKQKDTFNLQGIAINDPSISEDAYTEDIPSYQFALNHQKDLGLNDTFIAQLKKEAKQQGVTTYLEDHLVFPPKGPILAPKQLKNNLWSGVYEAAAEANKCFNVYNIDDKCPLDTDPLGFAPDQQEASTRNFINDTPGFKKYVHADQNTKWVECTDQSVFVGRGGDKSPAPTSINLLGQVADKSIRTVVQHGLSDYVLIANGTLLGIQNSTWGGLQGFQTSPFDNQNNLIVDGKAKGSHHTERNFTFATVDKASHMIPQSVPAASYKLQQFFLGQIQESDLSK